MDVQCQTVVQVFHVEQCVVDSKLPKTMFHVEHRSRNRATIAMYFHFHGHLKGYS